jgi:hypothetical protein
MALALLAFAAPAFAETLKPWWHVTSGSRPTYLTSGTARDEVQALSIQGGAGEHVFLTAHLEPREVKEVVEGRIAAPAAAVVAVGAEAGEIQHALEEEKVYAAGEVEVSEEVVGLARVGLAPYLIAFKGGLADQSVGLLTSELSAFEEGFQGSATVSQTVAGRNDGEIVVTLENLGTASTGTCVAVAPGAGKYTSSECEEEGAGEFEKTPVKITDVLPRGFTAVAAGGGKYVHNGFTAMPCRVEDSGSRVTCEWESFVAPYGELEVRFPVAVTAGTPSGADNEVSVSGGQAPAASLVRPVAVKNEATLFGVEDYELVNEEAGGAPVTQAGRHPFQQTTTIGLNQSADTVSEDTGAPGEKADALPVALAKDLNIQWPPGLIGNPTAFPHCTTAEFLDLVEGGDEDACPADTAVGVANVAVNEVGGFGYLAFTLPLFNLEPDRGEPARFGFYVTASQTPVYIDTAVRTGGDYGVTVEGDNISQTAAFLSAHVTVWGVPGSPSHDDARGWQCLSKLGSGETCSSGGAQERNPVPFLVLPTSCTGPLQSTIEGDSWTQAGERKALGLPAEQQVLATATLPALSGCDELPFDPSIGVSPDVQAASEPSGLKVDVHVPQEVNENAAGLAGADVKDIRVVLPEGVTLNPSAADGLQACSESEIGYTGSEEFNPHAEPHNRTQTFTPKLPEPLEPGLNLGGEGFCPNASKIATVKIHTPLLPNDLEGFVYLASPQNFHGFPQENPFESLLAMYIVAEDPVSGSLVKLPGKVTLNQQTGQIESTFENNPQLAFEDAELHFFGGERAPLATPAHCGAYTTDATFTPWSANPPVQASSTFDTTSGPDGTACPGQSLPFAPSMTSGTTNNNAGAFSALTTTLSRPSGQQNIQSVTLHYPPGLSGVLSGVELCPEPQANQGTCGPESQIGETVVSVGVGGDPFTVTGGKAYITGPYNGSGPCTPGEPGCAPFGLSIVNPAKAGPFDLQHGEPVVVRAKVEVNPVTAALTIVTNNAAEPYHIPTIIEGFPLQIQHVNVLVNRPGFTFNPTNCNPMKVTGTINSAEGASSPVEVPLQATNCSTLKFAPDFKVTTSANTSKANGASLTTKILYPATPPGAQETTYANIAGVKVDLPKQLPSRLTTLQKACLASVFEINPANCPAASIVGHARIITPLLPVPLTGPAYFVSHGNEAFPSLTMVLQGYGITIDLVGSTFIKNGITSSTFKNTPDAPVSMFELKLPEGKYSALAANGNLCKTKLNMPTAFQAQNGTQIHQTTKITVTGCPKPNTHHKTKKTNTKHPHKHK